MKKTLFIMLSVLILNATAEAYDFSISELGALWGHTTVHVNYDVENDYAQVTLDPADPWAAQAGWDFGVAPVDFTGYTHLVLDFEAVSVSSTHMQFHVESTVNVDDKIEIVKDVVKTANQVVINLKTFTIEQLASIRRVSIWVWDDVAETAVFKIKRVFLLNSEESDFPLVELGALWGHTTVITAITPDAAYNEITFKPTGGYWEAQAGWDFGSSPKDLTAKDSLVVEFEEVGTIANVLLEVVSSNDVVKGVNAQVTNNRIVLDLTAFPSEDLASIARVSFMVLDGETETAILKVKRTYVKKGFYSGITESVDVDNELVDVYAITGIRVRTQVNKNDIIKELPKGLYIIGNKKVCVNN